jgi:DsbC/DsbD-like thiol-disulfide interchange protein/cytochrome c biogenesis protein CcdA
MRVFTLLLGLVALLFAGQQAQAQLPGMEIHVAAGLEAETLRPAAGSTVTLAITMRPDAGWHGYWSNPGDAGEGLALDWTLPAGASTGAPRFPVPETLIISGFMNYVYERPHAVLVDLKLPEGLAVGTEIPVSVVAYWLACTDRVCVPQQDRLELALTVGDGKIASANRSRFDAWRAALPVPLDRTGRFAVNGKNISLAIPYPSSAPLSAPYFFPAAAGLIDHMATQNVRRNGDWLVITTKVAPTRKTPFPDALDGLLRNGADEGLLVKLTPGAVPVGGEAIGTGGESTGATPPFVWLILGALGGGILLNIMPCVFPILGLKALALAKAGGDEGAARADALAYSAGVVLSCLALGAIILLLRAGGEEVGWAFQLQEPVFVLFLLLLMVGVTANLLGWFNLGSIGVGDSLTRQSGPAGSFWTGVLAALVATPCTGPFMAAALGAALLLPAGQAMLLFACLGIGVALPFLAIAYIKPLRGKLPRPGPWLETFRKAMAVPMALTALALFWLFWRLMGNAGLGLALAGAVTLVIILRIARQRLAQGSFLLPVMAFVLVLSISVLLLPAIDRSASLRATSMLPSERFSEARLATLRNEGKPLFVYFTADWCVTCKINEAAVLEREETAKLFAERGITVLRGDFTKRSPEIARFLAAQGAAGIPLYLFYPAQGDPQKLPQILTNTVLREATKI